MQQAEQDRKLCDTLLESIDETLTGLLSLKVLDALYLHIQTVHSISRDEVPYKLETLCSTLERIFGRSSKTVCKAIARRFYAKLGLAFLDYPGRTLVEYVEQADIKLHESGDQL